MYKHVKIKSRPVDAKFTLAELRKDPYHFWLRYIEPRIVCMGTSPEDCWCWDFNKRTHKPNNWYPQVWVSYNLNVEHPVRKMVNARRFIMELFYEFPPEYSVYRDKNICTSYNCVRPSHLIIAPHNDSKAKYGT